MQDNDTKRLSRLTAILTQLQSKKLLNATKLSEKFGVSIRTIYRDIRALEQAGVPIITHEGIGYSLMEGYRIPPVMFTESEANALITAELIIQSCKDESLIKEFSLAIEKLKAVIPNSLKSKTEMLVEKLGVTKTYTDKNVKSKYLVEIQKALIDHSVIKIRYENAANISSTRELEPFAIFSNQTDEWVLIAFCRLKKDFRSFSLARINSFSLTNEKFEPHQLTFAEYREKTYGN
jgi:predicted DNA-binding transcriptional regulator YafY